MTKPKPARFDEDDVLRVEEALKLLTAGENGGVWGLFDVILAQEREDKVSVALFDDTTSKKFYAGYITAIDMLRGLPALLLQHAEGIKERRDEEAKVSAKMRGKNLIRELSSNEGSIFQ